jgi:hypothetical protein
LSVETSLETELERFSNLTVGSTKVQAQAVMWTVATGGAATIESVRPEARCRHLPANRVDRRKWSAAHRFVTFTKRIVFPSRHEQGRTVYFRSPPPLQEAISKVSEALTCVNADDDLAAKLNVPRGQALLHISRVAFNASGQPVEWSQRTMHIANAEYVVTMA